jgi:hypothetical protein
MSLTANFVSTSAEERTAPDETNSVMLQYDTIRRWPHQNICTLVLHRTGVIVPFSIVNAVKTLTTVTITKSQLRVYSQSTVLGLNILSADFTDTVAFLINEQGGSRPVARRTDVNLSMSNDVRIFFGSEDIHAANLSTSIVKYGGWRSLPGFETAAELTTLHLTEVAVDFTTCPTVADLTLFDCSGVVDHCWPALKTLALKGASHITMAPNFSAPQLLSCICTELVLPVHVLSQTHLKFLVLEEYPLDPLYRQTIESCLARSKETGAAYVHPVHLAQAVGAHTVAYQMSDYHEWVYCGDSALVGEIVDEEDESESESESEDEFVNDEEETKDEDTGEGRCFICLDNYGSKRQKVKPFECEHEICSVCEANLRVRSGVRDDAWLTSCSMCRSKRARI